MNANEAIELINVASGIGIRIFEMVFLMLFACEIGIIIYGFCGALVALYRQVADKLQSPSVAGAALATFSTTAGIIWGACCLHLR
jgi:hypothetical protein